MVWKVRVRVGKPIVRIVWDNLFYRTSLQVNGKVYPPDSEVVLNIATSPRLNVTLVGENIGDAGIVWGGLFLKDDIGHIVPLVVKQDIVDSGGLIVVEFDSPIDRSFIDFLRYLVSENLISGGLSYSIVGYVGTGDIRNALNLPLAYVRDITNHIVRAVNDDEDLMKLLEEEFASATMTVVAGRMIEARMPAIHIISLMPIRIDRYGINIRSADAGFNFYEMYTLYREDFNKSGIEIPFKRDWGLLAENSMDSTEKGGGGK